MGKYLVTGGTGFLGSWLIHALSARGDQIVALVRNEKEAGHIRLPGVTFAGGDILSRAALEHAAKGCDGIFHLAAYAKVWSRDPQLFYTINLDGTMNVLEAAKTQGVPKLVFCSSAGVLGPSTQGALTEKTIRNLPFFNDYETSKAAAEQKVMAFAKEGHGHAVVVSPTRAFGPYLRGKPESISLLIKKYVFDAWKIIPGSGKQIANYVFVKDVAQGMILAMDKGESGENYLLGGSNLSYDEFFAKLAAVSGVRHTMIHLPLWIIKCITVIQRIGAWLNIPPTMTPEWLAKLKANWEVDIGKAQTELGYSPGPIEQGFADTIGYLKSAPKNTESLV